VRPGIAGNVVNVGGDPIAIGADASQALSTMP
jgi:hypothetical protein